MAQLYRVPTQNNSQYTLDSQIAAGATSLTLNSSVASIVRAPGVIVIDRVDSAGNKTATKREYKSFTGVSGANLTGLAGGLAGSTDQVHAVGAIVEFVPDVIQEDAWYNVFTTEHTDFGQHGSLISLSVLRTRELVGSSHASLNTVNMNSLGLESLASLNFLQVKTFFGLSGASFTALPIRPYWVIKGVQSALTTGIGTAIQMPESGTLEHVSVVLTRGRAVSSASLLIDINKNGTSIFDAGTRPGILGAGTYISTASIATKTFNRGDIFDLDVDNVGNQVDFTALIVGR